MEKVERKRSYKARNREETHARILSVAIEEFTEHGYIGARVERIASRSDVTLRMIYYYFKSKASLYATVLKHVFGEAAEAERAFDPGDCPAEEGMRQLVRFAFDHFAARPDMVRLELGENMMKGEFLRHASIKPLKDMPLYDRMKDLLQAGQKEGVFKKGIDAAQAWVLISSLCRSYLLQGHTLSWKLDSDLSDPAFAKDWRKQVERTVLAALAP